MLYSAVPDIDKANLEKEIRRSIKVLCEIAKLRPSELLVRTGKIDMKNLVTVIIPMFNARDYVDMCLKSIIIQSHRDIEIFCVDDHSTDDTYARVVELFGKDRRICVIRLAKNVGPYQIKNWVISRLSRGCLIAMQDVDDVSHPMRIAIQRKWIFDNDIGVCGVCVHQFFPSHIRPAFGTDFSLKQEGDEYEHSLAIYSSIEENKDPLNFAEILGNIRKEFIANHGSQMFRKNLLFEFGGFNGHTKFGADTDLDWRLLRFSSICNIQKVLYFRRFHEHSLTRNPVTGIGSASRRKYVQRRDAEHEQIRVALERGDFETVRALCTRDFYCEDVRVDEVHSNFDIAL